MMFTQIPVSRWKKSRNKILTSSRNIKLRNDSNSGPFPRPTSTTVGEVTNDFAKMNLCPPYSQLTLDFSLVPVMLSNWVEDWSVTKE